MGRTSYIPTVSMTTTTTVGVSTWVHRQTPAAIKEYGAKTIVVIHTCKAMHAHHHNMITTSALPLDPIILPADILPLIGDHHLGRKYEHKQYGGNGLIKASGRRPYNNGTPDNLSYRKDNTSIT